MSDPQVVARLATTLLSIIVVGSGHAQESVEVFQLSTQYIRGTDGAIVHYVDDIERVTASLSTGLPPSPEAATPLARERFAALSAAERPRIEAGARTLVLSVRYRLTKLPAIVFDRHAIVYGMHDVALARSKYLAWRASR